MRKYVLLAILALNTLLVQAKSLTIIHEDYTAAKEAAIKEHKLLLIDFYTTWCGPCKRLSKAVFDSDKYASQIAENYVLLKYDAEKDSVFNLSKKYHVSSYPTGVVITADGKTIHKKYGVSAKEGKVDAEDYLAFLNKASELHKAKKYIKGITQEINLNYPKFYADYVNRSSRYKKDDIANYWSSVQKDDYFGEVQFAVLAYFGGTPTMNTFFLENTKKYAELYGEADVNMLSNRIVSRTFNKALKEKDEKLFNEALAMANKHIPKEDRGAVVEYYTFGFWQATGNWTKIADYAASNQDKLNKSGEMNSICWAIFQKCDDMAIVKKAVTWMEAFNKNYASFASMDTYANLLHKAGDTKNAIKYMEQAIEMGKEEKTNIKDSEKALAEFKAAL